jgi:excisionase family DNA binding protein
MFKYKQHYNVVHMSGDALEDSDEFYAVEEVAKKLKISCQTVRTLIRDGDLLACRFSGNIVRIRKDDYEAYVNISRGATRGTVS